MNHPSGLEGLINYLVEATKSFKQWERARRQRQREVIRNRLFSQYKSAWSTMKLFKDHLSHPICFVKWKHLWIEIAPTDHTTTCLHSHSLEKNLVHQVHVYTTCLIMDKSWTLKHLFNVNNSLCDLAIEALKAQLGKHHDLIQW
jgi:hypothetical protein